jgi:hypothetical protein
MELNCSNSSDTPSWSIDGSGNKQSVTHPEEHYKNPADQGVNPAFNRLQLEVQAPNKTPETLAS